MRKTSSFHLEEDIINEIVTYQKTHNLSSRNIALERMILEIKSLKKELQDKTILAEFAKTVLMNNKSNDYNIDNLQTKQTRQENIINKKKDEPKIKNEKVRKSIRGAFDSMPEGSED